METPLKRVRERRGLMQKEVASAVKAEKSHYCRVESGEQIPSPALAERIAVFFGHEVTELQLLYPQRYAPETAAAVVTEPREQKAS